MEYEISNRLSGVHGSMIRELFKFKPREVLEKKREM